LFQGTSMFIRPRLVTHYTRFSIKKQFSFRCFGDNFSTALYPLKGQVAIVTGGSRGIGKSIAFALAQRGANIAVLSRRPSDVHKTLPLVDQWQHHNFFLCDVSKSQEVRETVSKIEKDFGPIHILINNAGICYDSLLLSMSDEQLVTTLQVNLLGPLFMARAVVMFMLKRRCGSIVNIGSVVGSFGNAGQVAYSSSKAGLIGMTKSLAKELGPKGIRVNLIEPGLITTEMTSSLSDTKREKYIQNIPLGRMGTPEEVANAVEFVILNSYINGEIIRVSGGITSLGC
jgi:3-oxoacyl-[acyl-carrier protein] reductase